jgi:hypothetical protein
VADFDYLDEREALEERAAEQPVAPHAADRLLTLQRSAGNQAVGRLIQRLPPTPAPAPGVSPPSPAPPGSPGAARTLSFIKMKRKHIHLTGDDKYGHWWTEIDGGESYGWWPKNRVGLIDTLFGTEGELNGQTSFGGTATRDPHHGDTAEDEFSPEIVGPKTDDEVRSEMRAFAGAYSGEWRWTFGWGQNCHTFQESMMSTVGLRKP